MSSSFYDTNNKYLGSNVDPERIPFAQSTQQHPQQGRNIHQPISYSNNDTGVDTGVDGDTNDKDVYDDVSHVQPLFTPSYNYGSYTRDSMSSLSGVDETHIDDPSSMQYDASREILLLDALIEANEDITGYEDASMEIFTYPGMAATINGIPPPLPYDPITFHDISPVIDTNTHIDTGDRNISSSSASSTTSNLNIYAHLRNEKQFRDKCFLVLFFLQLASFFLMTIYSMVSVPSVVWRYMFSMIPLFGDMLYSQNQSNTSSASGEASDSSFTTIFTMIKLFFKNFSFSKLQSAIYSFLHSSGMVFSSNLFLTALTSTVVLYIWFHMLHKYTAWTLLTSISTFIIFCVYSSIQLFYVYGILSMYTLGPLFFAIIATVFYISIHRRIWLAEAILTGSISGIFARRLSFFIVILAVIFQFMWIVYWCIGSMMMLIHSNVIIFTINDVYNADNIDTGILRHVLQNKSSMDDIIVQFQYPGPIFIITTLFLALALYWPLTVSKYVAYSTVSGSIADWWLRHDTTPRGHSRLRTHNQNAIQQRYSARNHNRRDQSHDDSSSHPISTSPSSMNALRKRRGLQTVKSLYRSLTTSFGSICFAALVLTIVKGLSMALQCCTPRKRRRNYIESLASNGGYNNTDVLTSGSVALCCASTFVYILQKITEYCNEYSLVYISIYGDTFIKASRSTYSTLRYHKFLPIINDNITSFPVILGKVICIVASCGVSYLFSHRIGAVMHESVEIQTFFLLFWAFFISFVVSDTILSVITIAVKTTFIIWATHPNRMLVVRRENYHAILTQYDSLYG